MSALDIDVDAVPLGAAAADAVATARPAPQATAPRSPIGPENREERRPTFFAELREIAVELVAHRDLLVQLALRDIRVRYKQAALGFLWALVMPLVIVLAGLAVRFAIAYTAGRGLDPHQVAGMAVKAVPWAFFVGCLSTATPSLTANLSLVTKIYFPREVLPLAAILAQTLDSTIGLVVVALLLPALGVGVSGALVWVPLLLVTLWILALAVGLALSCANLFFRDVKYLVQVFLTFGIFITPVFLDASMFGPRGAALLMLNPVASILEGLRLAVVEHHNLLTPYTAPVTRVTTGSGRDIIGGGFVLWHPWYLAYVATVAVGGLALAARTFHRAERRFAEHI